MSLLGERTIGDVLERIRGRARIAARAIARRAPMTGDRVMPGQKGLRLHLGCGQVHLDGYVNVDVDPKNQPDVCMDFRDVRRAFEAGSVREVLMIHSLGYLRLAEARCFFRHVRDLLEPGGRFISELPDVSKCAAAILDAGELPDRYLGALRGFYAFSMGEVAREAPYVPYAFGWSGWHLRHELERAGFARIHIEEPRTHGKRSWRDVRIEAER